MAKKQTRRSISVSRTTYERLKSFCETQGISMSQFVENRVGDFLSTDGGDEAPAPSGAPRPPAPPRPVPPRPTSTDFQSQKGHSHNRQAVSSPSPVAPRAPTPMTSAAARYAVEPPPPIIKPREHVDAKPPVQPTADQIFTF